MSTATLDCALDVGFARDVAGGLARSGQKELPSQYLYDELGSILFDAITVLPEYGLSRADTRLLERYAPEIARCFPGDVLVAELGSGTGAKTRYVLQPFARRGPLEYRPIDISPTALDKCAAALDEMPGLTVKPIHASYLDGLRKAAAGREPGQALFVLFLGSTIGNFNDRAAREFLRDIRASLMPGDALLLGTDLIKPLPQMLLAYDDPLGVTAAFNLNVLARINRELGGEFDPRRFRHEARFNEDESRIEMHIRSQAAQQVRVAAIDRVIRFERDETIWTEGSYKFRSHEVAEMGVQAGFTLQGQWLDRDWPFAETLLRVA